MNDAPVCGQDSWVLYDRRSLARVVGGLVD